MGRTPHISRLNPLDERDPTLQRARNISTEYRQMVAARRRVPANIAPYGFGRVTGFVGGFKTFTLDFSKKCAPETLESVA